MRRVDRRDIGSRRIRQVRDRDIVPGRAVILRHLDEAIVGAGPNDTGRDTRAGERLDRPRCGCTRSSRTGPPSRGRGTSRRRCHAFRIAEVRADLLPVCAAIGGRHEILESEQQLARIRRRPGHRLVADSPQGETRVHVRADVDPLPARIRDLHHPRGRAARVDDLRVERIGDDVTELVSRRRKPIEPVDRAEIAAAPRCDGSRVLLRRIHPVRERVVGRDVIDLLGGLVVPRTPREPAVQRDRRALVHAQEHALAVGGIDPHLLRVVAAGCALKSGESIAAVERTETRGVDRVDDFRIRRIDVDAAIVSVLSVRDAPIIRRHLAPRVPTVVGTIETEVANQVHALAVRVHRDGDRRAARERGKAVAGDLLPCDPFVERLEQLRARRRRRGASRSAATTTAAGERVAVVLYRRREHHLRIVECPGDLLRAGLVVDVQRLRPIPAAVRAAENTAHVHELVDVALCRDQHQVRILRIDEDRRDLLRFVEPQVLPRLAGVDGLVHPVPLIDAAAGDEITHADVNDVGIGRRDLHRSDRRCLLHGIEDRIPRRAGARRLPHAAKRKPDIERAGLADHSADGRDASAAERTDHAPLQARDEVRLERRGRAEGEQSGEQGGAREPAGGVTWSAGHRRRLLSVDLHQVN